MKNFVKMKLNEKFPLCHDLLVLLVILLNLLSLSYRNSHFTCSPPKSLPNFFFLLLFNLQLFFCFLFDSFTARLTSMGTSISVANVAGGTIKKTLLCHIHWKVVNVNDSTIFPPSCVCVVAILSCPSG